jgi:RNA polymerase sigma-70 factor (ECF subfamily)
VVAVVARLRPELRELCERLRHMTLTEIARETGIPRGTLYERRSELQRIFEDAGLRDYLDE